jgi:hypothetical protein
MDKQKQIEEMAKLICRMPKKCDDCWQYECQAKDFASILYNAGYRKVCEPAIKNGEAVGFVNGADYVPKNLFLFGLSQARKETAEKFAERLKGMAYQSTDWSHGEHPMVVEVDYIDEIAQEITEVERWQKSTQRTTPF